jgi:anti-sigma regulatory factor (Ser/Thr protein kinase)
MDGGQREPRLAERGEPGSRAGAAIWPKTSTLRLEPVPAAAGQAREHARVILREWGLRHLIDDGVRLVSELVTNALQASWTLTEPAPVGLGLLADEGHLIIEAWDQCLNGTDFPAPDDPDEDDERGRGLLIVDILSNKWGVRRPRNLGFKVVWCELLISPRGAGRRA